MLIRGFNQTALAWSRSRTHRATWQRTKWVLAFVVVAAGTQTTERELLAWGREHLAPHQVPAFVTFVDRLPRNSVGKLVRAELQKRHPQHSTS